MLWKFSTIYVLWTKGVTSIGSSFSTHHAHKYKNNILKNSYLINNNKIKKYPNNVSFENKLYKNVNTFFGKYVQKIIKKKYIFYTSGVSSSLGDTIIPHLLSI